MMGIAENLRLRLEEVGMSQAELARQVGITQPTIASLLSGKSQGSKHLHKIARVLETTPEKLTGEDTEPANAPAKLADPRLAFRDFEQEADDDEVNIDHIDLQFGMGGTFLDNPVETNRRRFSREWLRTITNADPEHLVWATTVGDSMEPTIRSGEPILIDRSQTRVNMGDVIWVIAFGEVGMVKRLRPMPNGTMEILSDNPLVGTAVATDGELYVIGRVIAKVGRL